MSRSFKKKPYHSICKSRGDKWCRQQYHKERRQKDRRLCKEMEGRIDKELLYNDRCFLCTKDGVQPEEKFINENIDYSLRFADKWGWSSDGGNYYWGGKDEYRRDFERQIFGLDYKYGIKRQSLWEKYKDYVDLVYNEDKPLYTVVLKRVVIEKVNWGFYMPWSSEFAGKRKEEKKYITTEIYPPKYKPEEGWEIIHWWKRKNYLLSLSNWDLFGFLFRSRIIPLNFKNEKQLVDWFRENEETIIEKWMRAFLLRK
jgi:hypothetical protein